MSDADKPRDIGNEKTFVIPNGTQIIIIDLDYEMARIESSLDGKVMRAWVAAEHFRRMLRN